MPRPLMKNKDYYSIIANSYNELHEKEQLEKLSIIKKHLKLKEPLLDIGAGTGLSTSFFKAVKDKVALDPSKGMLKQYKGKKVCAKAEDIPFPDKTFSTIISVTALHHTNIDKAIKEIKRVAKPGCRFAFTILKKSKTFKKIKEKLMKNFRLKVYESDKDLILISEK